MSDPTLRDAIESALDAAPEPQSAAPAPDPAPAPVASSAPPPAEPATSGRARDEQGRFSKLAEEEQHAAAPTERAAEGIKPGPKAEPKPASVERPPSSWRPDVREHWSQLPESVRAEVARRESEVQRAIAETTRAREVSDQLTNVVRPYEAFIRAENSNPLQAIDSLLSTAVRLRTAPAPDLASMVAGIVKQFGVGRFGQQFIGQLDSALAGEMPQSDPSQAQLQQVIQQQLAPVQQFMSQFQQAQVVQQQRAQQEAVSEVQGFLTQAEFGEDVREEMADLLEVAQRRGRELSLQDAYRQACLANPRVRAVLEGRAKAGRGQVQTSAAQRAKAAAVSVSGGPAISAPRPDTDSVRSAIEAAIAANSR